MRQVLKALGILFFLSMAVCGADGNIKLSHVSQVHGSGYTEIILSGEGIWTLTNGNQSTTEVVDNLNLTIILYNQTAKGQVDYKMVIDVSGHEMAIRPSTWEK